MHLRLLTRAALVALAFGIVGLGSASWVSAAPPPTVDGDIDDLLAYSADGADCGLTINDAAQDVCKTDAQIVPCVAEIACPAGGGTYFVNGFDFTISIAAYDATNNDLYLGFRTVGNIGDANGDGDTGLNCAVPGANVSDAAEISLQEQYTWELDTNCDGSPDILVEVRGDEVDVIGAATSGASFQFNGTDLEVVVNGIQLPAIWRLRPFIGSTTDGLSEDTAPQAECPPPLLDLEIDKSVNVGTVCPGGTVRFTVEVSNTGEAALLVELTDQLPVGLTYANNVSGDFTVFSEVGGLITFNDLTIPAGESRDVSFDATASLECFGEVTNVATATGSFDDPCLEDPLGVGPVQDDASVVCGAEPCVELDIDCPPAACEGESILLSATVTNCGDGDENITVTIAGEDTTFLDVPADGERTWDRYVIHGPCVNGSVNYAFSATATNDCGTGDPVNDNCIVNCEDPSIDVSISAPAEVASGEGFCYTINVTNNGTVTLDNVEVCADICQYVTYAGNASPTPSSEPTVGDPNGEICWEVGTLAPGASQELSFCVTAEGLCPEVVNCLTSVTATGNCADADASDTDNANTLINCPQGLCWMTSGGNNSGGDGGEEQGGPKYWTWGGNVYPGCNEGNGNWEHVERDGDNNILFNFHSDEVVVLNCYHDGGDGPCHPGAESNVIVYGGTGFYNEGRGKRQIAAVWEAQAEDHGEPGNTPHQPDQPGGCGSPDRYIITVRNAETNEVVFTHDELVHGGNIQIHPCKNQGGDAVRTDVRPTGSGFDDVETPQTFGMLELYRPAPNPFTHETQIAYAVEGSEARHVEIGIYDVAGRQVKKLVSGSYAPGRYTATWDGRDGSGAQITRGVYFLRAIVGMERVAMTRILYLR